MTPEEWRRAKDLFHEALELPVGGREAFLKAAGAEPQVVSEVLRLLGQQGSAGSFLETPAAAFSPDLLVGDGGAGGGIEHPDAVGPYRILGLLGEGGMGVVYRAEQESPNPLCRLVKLIRCRHRSHAKDHTRRTQAMRQRGRRSEVPTVRRSDDWHF